MTAGSPTIRVRVAPARREELEELRTWTSSKTMADLFWKAIDALKRESSFDDRIPLDEEQPPGLPPLSL